MRNRVAHSLLDLALGGDAYLLQELSDAGVEGILVHTCLLRIMRHQ